MKSPHNLLRNQSTALRAHSRLAYQLGMSRCSLCGALHLGLLATVFGGFQ
jgi:hypothetical protein